MMTHEKGGQMRTEMTLCAKCRKMCAFCKQLTAKPL